MSRPALIVDVAFTTNPNDPAAVISPTWTDISEWVRAAPTVERSKRSTELDRFETGTCKLTLDNTDGRFSPTNTSSPYAGNLVPYRMIRIRGLLAGTYYPLWQGFVERWPTSWTDPARGLAEIECVDLMAIASQIGMESAYGGTVVADGPLFYYPLSDADKASEAANQSTTPQPNATIFHDSAATHNDETFAFGGSIDKAPGFDGASGLTLTRSSSGTGPWPGYGLRLPNVPLAWSSWSIECWVQMTDSATAGIGDIFWVYDTGNAPTEVRCYSNGSGNLVVQVTTPDGVTASQTTTFNVGNGFLHHVSMSWTTPFATVWVNDFAVATLNCTGSTFLGTRSCLVQFGSRDTAGAGIPVKRYDIGASAMSGILAQIAIYEYPMTYDQHELHEAAGRLPFSGQLFGDRAQTLMDQVSWPLVFRDVQTGSTVLQPATGIGGRSLLDNLQDLADTENGTLSCSAVGTLQVYGRDNRTVKGVPSFTFGSNVAAGEIPYQLDSLRFDFDPTLVFNDVAVERRDGATARVFDSASILAYFDRTLSRSSLAASDSDPVNSANWLLDRYAQPALRAETITIAAANLGSDVTNLWQRVLSLDLHERIRVNHRPMNQPAITFDGYIDQLSHAIDPDSGQWNVTLQISPAIRDYWLLADTAGGVHTWDAQSVLGSTTRLSY